MTSEEIRQKEKEIKTKKFNNTLTIIKCTGDSITSTQALGWPVKYLGIEGGFNDGLVGAGGLTSALISCYNAYPAAKK